MTIVRSVIACVCVAGLATAALGQEKKPAQPVKPAEAPKAAQPSTPAKPAEPAKPAAPAKPGEAPAAPGQIDMQAAMEAWMKSSTPGKMHEVLASHCGTWEGKVSMWMDPSGKPTESHCTAVISSMMGGRFTRSEIKGNMDMGTGQLIPFEGFGLYGYNNVTEKFESTWCDNLGTLIMNFTGTLSADGKTMTWNSKFIDPMTRKECWMREVERVTGPDTMTLEMYGPTPDGKGEMKSMQIEYTRKPGTGPKKADAPK